MEERKRERERVFDATTWDYSICSLHVPANRMKQKRQSIHRERCMCSMKVADSVELIGNGLKINEQLKRLSVRSLDVWLILIYITNTHTYYESDTFLPFNPVPSNKFDSNFHSFAQKHKKLWKLKTLNIAK